MGDFVKNLLGGGPVSTVLGAVEGIIGKFVTDPTQKLQATIELTKAQNELTEKLAELDAANYAAQRDVIVAEAKSESWITRNWRPLVALGFAVHVFVIVWSGGVLNGHTLTPAFIADMMSTVKLCLGGYYIGRSVEKAGPDVAGKIAEVFASKTK
jgi:hypothetical protein